MSAFGGFKNAVVAGVKLIREAIQSPNYVTGVSGWTINKDGSAEFSNATLRGGSVTGPRVVVGNDPLAEDLGLTASVMMYWGPGRAFLIGVQEFGSPDIGQFRLWGVDDIDGIFWQFLDITFNANEPLTYNMNLGGFQERSNMVTMAGNNILPNVVGNTTLGPVGTTNVAVYANAPGSLINFTKHYDDTILQVKLNGSCWANGGSAEVRFAISVNGGVDNEILRFTINNAGQHVAVPEGLLRFAGIPSGSVSVQGRWKRQLGAGTVTMDATDTITVEVSEVAP